MQGVSVVRSRSCERRFKSVHAGPLANEELRELRRSYGRRTKKHVESAKVDQGVVLETYEGLNSSSAKPVLKNKYESAYEIVLRKK